MQSPSTNHLENFMSYSDQNPAWARMHETCEAEEARSRQAAHDELAEREKARAQALQKLDPSLTWGQALALAAQLPVPRQAG